MKFLDKLLRIPHLDLGFQFDTEALVREFHEAADFKPFVPYETQYADETDKSFYRESWSGLSIVGESHDCQHGMTEDTGKTPPPAYETTDIAHLCYEMLNAVEMVIGSYRTTRVRIMKIPPGRSLGWHSHTKDHYQAATMLTVQIPILMPDDFEYAVTTEDNIKSRLPPVLHDRSKAFIAHYRPGRAYIFNSYQYHNVFNRSDETRVTLMFYGNVFSDSWFRDNVEAATEKYNGPLL